jgi:ATP-dependent helicase/DNAse subunit B
MRVVVGPPGSGKSAVVWDELREALRRRDDGVRLVTPTATMAEHIRHALAREGFLLRPRVITTLSGLVAGLVGESRQISDPALLLCVRQALDRGLPKAWEAAGALPGFAPAFVRTMLEFADAGCDAQRLAAAAATWPAGAAFAQVYREVERMLEVRGRLLRPQLLRAAARAVKRTPRAASSFHTLWLDGFFTFTEPERELVTALGRVARVVVTLPEVRQDVFAGAAEVVRLERRRALPRTEVFSAEDPVREAGAIALRILRQLEAGRACREIGVVVRNPAVYLEPLALWLHRFGIPFRSYFPETLAGSPVMRFLDRMIEALLLGWEHEPLLEAWRAAGWREPLDQADFALRERLPSRGLAALEEPGLLPGELAAFVAAAASFEPWARDTLLPEHWVERLGLLRAAFPAVDPGGPPEMAAVARARRAALAAADAALAEAAALLSGRAMSLREFWRLVRPVLEQTPLRQEDRRRNVVHVLSVYEARQWELPLVFLCGLTEKEFPKRAPQDPFFPDRVRRDLRAAGIAIRTAREWEQEEELLFEVARTRAAESLTFSFPETDAAGNGTLPSRFLEGLPVRRERQDARPRPDFTAPVPLPALRSPEVLTAFRQATRTFSPSGLESYLECPFLFYAQRALRLAGRPPRPGERLDAPLRGEIVHRVLAALAGEQAPLEELFERIFQSMCDAHAAPRGYRTEQYRRQMLDDLTAFLRDAALPPPAATSTEVSFDLPFGEGLRVRGRLDRLDRSPAGAVVIDYKYSLRPGVLARVNGERSLQGPLYALAAEALTGGPIAAMLFAGLRRDSKYDRPTLEGWSVSGTGLPGQPLTREWLEAGRALASQAAGAIWSGRFVPDPADAGRCRTCDARDVCRYEAGRALPAEAG